MTSKKQQALDTQQKILRITEKMVRERGTFDLSMEEIARACGIVKGTLYHYYRSKEELLRAVSQIIYDGLHDQFLADAENAPALDQLRRFIRQWYVMTDQVSIPFDAGNNALVNEIGKRSDAPSPQENGLDIIEDCLRRAVAGGELAPETPVDALALTLIFAMHGSALHRYKYDRDFDLLAWSQHFVDLLFDYFLKPYTRA